MSAIRFCMCGIAEGAHPTEGCPGFEADTPDFRLVPSTPSDSSATAQPLGSALPALAHMPRILDRFVNDLRRSGVVGEDRNAKVLYLAQTSRFLDELVSVAVKGTSSSGKSVTVKAVSRFFPPEAFVEMTAMSERALVYSKDEYSHRTLILYEAPALREGVEGNLTAYFIRSLLSEGRINYSVTVRDKDGNWTSKTIEKRGPTNLIVTTTQTELHGENETRLISLPTDDSAAQTHRVLLNIASGRPDHVDLSEWHALQSWLASAEHRVEIPYSHALAKSIPPVAVRLRRDFRAILSLIRSHAVLHQLTRERDAEGRILASLADYEVVRDLVSDLVSEGVGATVSDAMRETVEAVRSLSSDRPDGVQVMAVAERLKLDKSTASRRLRAARGRGYLENREERRGKSARYTVDEPMPDEVELLPQRDALFDEPPAQGSGCTVARGSEGIERPEGAAAVTTGTSDDELGRPRIQREAGEVPEADEAAALARLREELGAFPIGEGNR